MPLIWRAHRAAPGDSPGPIYKPNDIRSSTVVAPQRVRSPIELGQVNKPAGGRRARRVRGAVVDQPAQPGPDAVALKAEHGGHVPMTARLADMEVACDHC